MRHAIITFCFMILASAGLACGAELLVPSQFATIQSAIDAAINADVNGDTVLIDPRVSNENKKIDLEPSDVYVSVSLENNHLLASMTIYVDADANGQNNGSSWQDAFNNLQDAIELFTKIIPIDGDQILVAQGIYKPDRGTSVILGDRKASFQLINGLSIKGGYAGFDELNPNTRDPNRYKTILSGDLNGDDGLEFINKVDNSYHVVNGSYTNRTAVLDGFIITGGNAVGDYTKYYHTGGGVFNRYGNPTLTNCVISDNFAWNFGGGMYNFECSPLLTNCRFIGNRTIEMGGGIRNYYGEPILINCTFLNNESGFGGAIAGYMTSWPKLMNCVFICNFANLDGGALFNDWGGIPILANCTFIANTAKRRGGGIHNDSINSSPTVSNCIFWENIDAGGNNEFAKINGGSPAINYSCIQGWTGALGGIGNIYTDPCFVESGYWDTNNTQDDANDDFWVVGDYRLRADSPCIDAGEPNYVSGPNETDLDGSPRVIGGRIDMGAYEYMPPIEVEVDITPDVLNLKSKGQWITCKIMLPRDYNAADVDAESILLEELIEPRCVLSFGCSRIIFVKFDRDEVQSLLEPGEVELMITGFFKNGIPFEGSDVITVIGPVQPHQPRHWPNVRRFGRYYIHHQILKGH